jgi:hypothetical protein
MKFIKYLFIALFTVGCSSVILKPVDFSWPIEDVVKVNEKGFISVSRYTFSVNVKNVFQEEFADSNLALGKEVRIIRDKQGYYFITGSNFKNVYLFMPVEGGMKLENKIVISETEKLESPVFNQKSPNIELIDGSKKFLLDKKGIVR